MTQFSKLFLGSLLGMTTALSAQAADLEVPQNDVVSDDRFSIFGIPVGGAKFPERYVPSVTNPLFNESPFITSEIKLIYLYNDIPNTFPGDGGNIQVAAAQARLKITDKLALIATKDGYVFGNFNGLAEEDGFVNIAGGLKYAFYNNEETGSILTGGLRAEIVTQELATAGGAVEFQGAGAGFINPFLTGATTLNGLGFLDGIQVQGSVGANIAIDPDAETSLFHFSLHANYELFENFFPLIEVNGFVPFNHADRLNTSPLNQLDGVDLVNFGSSDRDTTVTIGGGFRYRFNDNAIFGAAAETAVTNNDNSILDWRVTTDLTFNF